MAPTLSADTSWFEFSASGGGDFSVYAFSGEEEVCKPYEFRIELVSRSASADIAGLLGTPACLSIADRSGAKRLVHGLIREMQQLHTANAFTHYRCVLVPRLWFLSRISDHRIFQNLSVVEIIQQILKEQGFDADGVSFKLSYTYEPREYCVQYGETDLHFISRLCEEEGIYFYFEHTEDAHTLCFCDREGGPKIAGESDLRFYPGSGHAADTAVVSRLNQHHAINSNAAAYREWNFKQPKLDLSVSDSEGDASKAPAPPGMTLEQYRYPHLYELKKTGTRYAKLQVSRQLTFARWIECEADVSRFLPSYVFSIHEHPRTDVNAGWWVTRVRHEGEQPGVLEHESPDDRGLHYRSFVTAIPEETRFIPALEHPKRLVTGQQTAIVTGPEGEEIYPDEYGRVKVQFFWDREGQWDEKTTCWIRVSQGWAGTAYGTMAIPRIGHEVIVSFLEGNPDRPLITGWVYHDLNKIPYELPANKTRTVFKSMSTPGEKGEARGFNEFRIEDKKGEEEIYLHAEKDVNAYVKNDWKEHILHDAHRTVDHFTYLDTKGETHETLRNQRKTELFANDNLTVHADSHTKVDGRWLGKAGTEIHLYAGEKLVVEAGTEATLKGGGSWIKIDPSGIRMGGGSVRLGSGGSPGVGSGANPLLPVFGGQQQGFATAVGPEGEAQQLQDVQSAPEDDCCKKWNMLNRKPGGTFRAVHPCLTNIQGEKFNRHFDWVQKEPTDWSVRFARAVAPENNKNIKKLPRWKEIQAKITPGKDLRALAESVNSEVNKAVKYGDDIYLYGQKDYWASGEETLSKWNYGSYGDCEDFAILKYIILRDRGVPEEHMRILVHKCKDIGHAILLVYDESKDTWYRLDNLSPSFEERCNKFIGTAPIHLIAPDHRTAILPPAKKEKNL